MDVVTGKLESKDDIKDEAGLYRRWMTEIQLAQKLYKPYWKECERIQKRYTDQSSAGKQRDYERSKPRYNILWSNTQTIKPTIYSQEPKAVARRRTGQKNAVARLSSEMIERMSQVNNELVGVDSVLSDCAEDFVLYARGVAWVRYEPEFGQVEIPVLDDFGNQIGVEMKEQIVSETVPVDYLERDDWLCSPARKWREVRWVARKAYMTKDQLSERFGEDVAAQCSMNFCPSEVDKDENPEAFEAFTRCEVWEIWDKESKSVFWVSSGYKDKILDAVADPLGLKNFFPCPEPAYATVGPKLVPVPDYCIWGDLAREVDRLTGQIVELTKALKVAGCYNAAVKELERLFTEGRDTQFIPVVDWGAFVQSGGVKGAMDFLPLSEIVEALARLYDSRRQCLEAIYEISGQSDLMRGQSDPRETATAQNIKGNFAEIRVRNRQREYQRFCRDVIALQAEVMCEHFQDETIVEMVGAEDLQPEEQQLLPAALEMIRDDVTRRFAIDIETDSTIEVDQEAEKQQRIEAVDAISNALAKLLPIAQAAPEWAPFVAESVGYVARTLQKGRDFEATIDNIIDKAKEQAQSPAPQQGDQMQQMMAQQQADQQAAAQQQQQQQQVEAQKAMVEQQKIESKERIESEKTRAKIAVEAQKARMMKELKERELEIKAFVAQAQADLQREREMFRAEQAQRAAAQKIAINDVSAMA